MSLDQAQKALDRAKINLMTPTNAFIMTVCFSLKHSFDSSIPTAQTDGLTVLYNPDYLLSLSEAEQQTLLLHETWHVCLDHPGMLAANPSLDGCKLNVAGDYVINGMLDEQGCRPLPNWLRDRQFDGLSTLGVYDRLPPQPPAPSMMDLKPSQGNQDAQDQLDDILVRAHVQASLAGQMPGNLPKDIQERLDRLLNPLLPWDRILRKHFHAFDKTNYSFRKPNRRFLPDHYLPSAHDEALGNVAMALDMSGSVSPQETQQFVTDVHDVLVSVKPKLLELVQFDTRVISVDQITSREQLLRMDFRGRGGTDIDPVMEWAQTCQDDVLVVFTDGYFSAPKIQPPIPVIWVIYNNADFTAPFGKVVHYQPPQK